MAQKYQNIPVSSASDRAPNVRLVAASDTTARAAAAAAQPSYATDD
jgi:hypothetical protein